MRPLPLMADRLRLSELPFDPRDLGFETVEFDHILDEQPPAGRADPADLIEPPDPESIPTTATTDVWVCDQHELICGNALVEERTYQTLMADDQAEIVFTDPPYNVKNAGHVTGRAGVREFAMAAGDLCSAQFILFLAAFCACTLKFVSGGAVLYICMDWRPFWELQSAADPVFGPLKNLIVWVKSNAGMGTFYRSQHELILVYAAPGGNRSTISGWAAKA
jgi:DNA methylase